MKVSRSVAEPDDELSLFHQNLKDKSQLIALKSTDDDLYAADDSENQLF